jgi:hypothetical protein
MSTLFFEKGGILFKGGHYLRKYGISFSSLGLATWGVAVENQ